MKKSIFVALAAAAACGGSSTAKTPALSITAPGAGASVALGTDADQSVNLSYTVSDFAVKPPGACGSVSSSCGHIHILIDGIACNSPNSPYNGTSVTAGTAVAKFARCSKPTGDHTVSLELHDDTHHAVNNDNGQQILATVQFTTR